MSYLVKSQFKDVNLERNGADRLRLPSDDNCEDDKEKTEDQECRCLKCRVSVIFSSKVKCENKKLKINRVSLKKVGFGFQACFEVFRSLRSKEF